MGRTEDQVKENRLRRMAKRRGMTLKKCRRRDPDALGYGTYHIVRQRDNFLLWFRDYAGGYGIELEEVEEILTDSELMEKHA